VNSDKYTIEGKVAIVTGAARGIGKAIALTLAEAGADITVVDLATNQLERVAEEVHKLGRKALGITANVTQEGEVKGVVEQTISQFGRIDILCNNAGIIINKPVTFMPEMQMPAWLGLPDGKVAESLTLEEWHRVIDTNLTSAFLFAQAIGPFMMKQRKGKVINISSTSAYKGTPYYSAYCVSKAGLSSFTRCLASEWAQFNININAVAPGTVNTEMTTPSLANLERKKLYLDAIPLGRLAEPQEVALLVLFLASDAADYVTGQTFVIDGGQLGRGPGI